MSYTAVSPGLMVIESGLTSKLMPELATALAVVILPKRGKESEPDKRKTVLINRIVNVDVVIFLRGFILIPQIRETSK